MKTEWRRFAPLGLVLALAALLAAVGLYVVQGSFTLAVQISLGMILIGLASFALLDPDRVRRMFSGRQARYGSNAFVLTIAFIGIVVVINYLVYNNAKTWDLTEDKQYTLAPETVDTLSKLPETVQARAFFSSRSSTDTAKDLLDQFKQNSSNKFDYTFVDPESDPVAAEQAGVTQDATIVLAMGERTQSVTSASEEELVSGLVRLMNPNTQSVYFLTGHGEKSLEEGGQQSYSLVSRTLTSKNYKTETLNLLATNAIPEDAKTIVIAGARTPLSDGEVTLLKGYLEQGGALIVLMEPRPLTDFGDAVDPLATYLQQTWGIEIGENIVVDTTSQQPYAPYAASYGQHAITRPFERTTTQFPTARTVSASAEAPTGVSLVQLALTAPQSWAETNLEGLADGQSQPQYDEGQDQLGPLSLAVAAENLETKGRVLVVGDSDFPIDANFSAWANGDFMISSVDWAVGQENLINLTPKNQTPRVLLPPQASVLNLIFLAAVIVMPGLALLAGILTFIQRRRRG
jgi:ABC-type uncharacterized transport system involved in gliding motility auxiliary subunit